jgi:hypothetical protein
MSNVERQRRFRGCHPGYFNRYHPRRRAPEKDAAVQLLASATASSVTPADIQPPAALPTLPPAPTFLGDNI